MEIEMSGEVWFWKGPAPHHFVTVPIENVPQLQDVAERVSYGWGMIPVTALLRTTKWTTSLFPKDGGYIVPLKSVVRKSERVELGDTVTIRLSVDV